MLVNDEDGEVEPAPFHYDWSDKLLNGVGHWAIEGYRESAKSQYCLRAYLLYCLTFPDKSRDFIVLIKNNDRLARGKLKEIIDEYKSNTAVSANKIQIREESGQVFSVDVEDQHGETINVRIEAYGKGSSIRGLSHMERRPKIVLIDDPQDLEDAESEAVTDSDWKWFLSDILFLGKKSKIFLIGNNLGERCILERAIANAKELGFLWARVGVMDEKEVPTWPANNSIESIIAEREKFKTMGELNTWFREKMCIALADENRKFTREMFKYFHQADLERIRTTCNIFIRTDLGTDEDGHDDYVIEVFGVNGDGYWFIFDVIHGVMRDDVFVDHLFSSVIRWKPINVGLERVAFQRVMTRILNDEMKRRGVFFQIVEQEAHVEKHIRIMAIQPRMKQGRIYFLADAPWTMAAENQFLMFPKNIKDDIIDTIASNDQHSHVPVSTFKRIAGQLPSNVRSKPKF